ncbi:DNA recombination-mediator protein DprA [Vitreoscilla sp. C1]|uniref:DNA-processing protein DprA n=1 Tax=Vitreoscilla sp. (strain C1) TaxID=96942 RepID=UPI000CDCDB73|nr:DNA-processing protein DprA [Vitreoscilla sp. C1]AUZ06445.1 DNA recombination-mediator protein DprA [Vitreoscilla sp. C1]
MNDAHRLAYLELALTPYVGPMTLLKILQYLDYPADIWQTPISALSNLAKPKAIQAIQQRQGKQALQDALIWESEHANNHLLSLLDDDYPLNLAQIDSPPPLLFAKGDLSLLHQPSIAIIGSRHATAQGLQNAHRFAADLSQHNMAIVSGFAAGIDTAAHQGCIQVNGATIAVLGTGIDRVYPAANRQLAHQICEKGLLLSEFALGTPPVAQNFPRRNRIIAALSQAILVVEAAVESGSLITARLGLEMNKEVMAIPGSIHNPHSKGCHALIKQGAKLIESTQDILEECILLPQLHKNTHFEPKANTDNHPNPSPLLQAMGFDPIHPDQLVDKLGSSLTDVYAELLELELQGQIAALTGGRYQRIH